VETGRTMQARTALDTKLEEAERAERQAKERAATVIIDNARMVEESDIKTKKARQVQMHLERTNQLLTRELVKKDLYSYWIEESKFLSLADEEALFRDYALDRQEHIQQEVERRDVKVIERQTKLEDAKEQKDKALQLRDESAQAVLNYSTFVEDARQATLERHDDALEENLRRLQKEQEDAYDKMDYAEKDLERAKAYERIAQVALEKALDRKKDAEHRMKAAGEEATTHEAHNEDYRNQGTEKQAKREEELAKLTALEEEPLVEVPVVQEKMIEPKVMVGRSKAQRSWGKVRNTITAIKGFKAAGLDPATLSEEEQLMSLNEVVSEELVRVHEELEEQALEDQANVDAKRWRMKYKYKYYYKYKARAEEEAGMQQNAVLGNLWDIDPAVAGMEGDLMAAELDAAPNSSGPAGSGVSGSAVDAPSSPVMAIESPPQLGRGHGQAMLLSDVGLESPGTVGEDGEIEFCLMTNEIDNEPLKHIVKSSKAQANHFQQKLHATGLQDKAFRSRTIPMQRGMRKETQAWTDLLFIVREKGAEEVKTALQQKEVVAVTSKNVRPAVGYLTRALEVSAMGIESPSSTPGAANDEKPKPGWDASKTPFGRKVFLEVLKKKNSEAYSQITANPCKKSPEKIGWDHDSYYRGTGTGRNHSPWD